MPDIRRQIELLLIGIQIEIGNILAEDIIALAKRRRAIARPSGAGIGCGSGRTATATVGRRAAGRAPRRRRSGRVRSGDRVAITVRGVRDDCLRAPARLCGLTPTRPCVGRFPRQTSLPPCNWNRADGVNPLWQDTVHYRRVARHRARDWPQGRARRRERRHCREDGRATSKTSRHDLYRRYRDRDGWRRGAASHRRRAGRGGRARRAR